MREIMAHHDKLRQGKGRSFLGEALEQCGIFLEYREDCDCDWCLNEQREFKEFLESRLQEQILQGRTKYSGVEFLCAPRVSDIDSREEVQRIDWFLRKIKGEYIQNGTENRVACNPI
jgi:hypothetical protein